MAFLQTGRSQTEIAGTLNHSKSTISREIRWNSFEGKYDPCEVQGQKEYEEEIVTCHAKATGKRPRGQDPRLPERGPCKQDQVNLTDGYFCPCHGI